jgi:hypothetical protein
MVKHELALQLVELHMLTIELGGNVGLPIFRNLGELVSDVDFIHVLAPGRRIACPDSWGSELVAKELLCGFSPRL